MGERNPSLGESVMFTVGELGYRSTCVLFGNNETVEKKRWLKPLKVVVSRDQDWGRADFFYHKPFGSIIFFFLFLIITCIL